MNAHTTHTQSVYTRIVQQGRMWFRYARILEAALRAEGSRLWVKPVLHARYGLRRSLAMQAHSFILPTRLDACEEDALHELLQQEGTLLQLLHPQPNGTDGLLLLTSRGERVGRLNRPAWSWVRPLVEIRYTPRFYLHEIRACEGTLQAHVVISHFHDGVEAFLSEHYRTIIEAALA